MSDEYKFQFSEDDDISSSSVSENEDQQLDLNSFSSATTIAAVEKKRKKKTGKKQILKVLLTFFLVGVITCSIVVGAFAVYVFTMIDSTMEFDLNDLKLNSTTKIYIDDGSGEFVEYQRIHGTFDRIWVDYDEEAAKAKEEGYTGIPQQLVNAFVAIEDKRFNDHEGTDWRRTIGAFVNMVNPFSEKSYGGSTITQQLVKNLSDDDERKASRKIREILRARYLEENYSKSVIMECYLNVIPLGHGKYGVEAASNYYFGKSVHELDLIECATLAAITTSPKYNAPDSYPDNNKRRRDAVLLQMLEQKYITEEEYNAVKDTEASLIADGSAGNDTAINSYFVDALIDQVVEDMCKKYNYDEKAADILFYSAGYKIYATIDPDIQAALESVYKDSATYGLKAKDGATMQGSMTVMDYKGNVLGLVGGIGEKDRNRGLNRATSAIRQPGSTIKPLSAYAPAIEQDLITYSTKLNDTATNYKGWKPVNWYGSYWGNVTVEYALERSINTIPVYLVNKMTPQTSFDFITQKLGVTTLTKNDVDLSPMGMGGTNGGFTTLESAAAFAMFGNNGLYYEPKLYTKVCDQPGDVILTRDDERTVAITEDTATVMNKLLQNVVYGSNGTGKGAGEYIPQMKIFAKTGTSNNQNDLWFVGGTPYYVGSSWCGYDTQQAISSTSIAQKMWGAAMGKIHKGLPEKEFVDSKYVEKRYFCTETGLLATSSCTSKKVGWYKKSNIPGICKTHSGDALGDPDKIAAEEEKKKQEAEKSESSSSSSASSNTSSTQSAASQTSSTQSNSTSTQSEE